MNDLIRRLNEHQTTTWFTHWLIAWAVWRFMAGFGVGTLGLAAVLGLTTAGFFYREWKHYQKHRIEGVDQLPMWIADGVLDMIGPVMVLASTIVDPWKAHTVGFAVMAFATVAWAGLGLDWRERG